MAQTKNILKHVLVETASARRKCYHKPNVHSITMGQPCLVVVDTASRARRNYCVICAGAIIELGENQIREMKQALSN